MNETLEAMLKWVGGSSGAGVVLWLLQRRDREASETDRHAAELDKLVAGRVDELVNTVRLLQDECKRKAEEEKGQRERGDRWQAMAEALKPMDDAHKLEIYLHRRTKEEVARSLETARKLLEAIIAVHDDIPGCEEIVREAIERLREDIILPVE